MSARGGLLKIVHVIACLDVHYLDATRQAQAAAVLFRDWTDSTAAQEQVVTVENVESYEPGQFFRRELPCLLAVLKTLPPVEIAIIDGYVWLDDGDREGDHYQTPMPGLGAHLHEALGRSTPVIGVAKSKFRDAMNACEITRGDSARPLFITAAGMAPEVAAEHVRSMHGPNRIPTLLARVDRLCRSAV